MLLLSLPCWALSLSVPATSFQITGTLNLHLKVHKHLGSNKSPTHFEPKNIVLLLQFGHLELVTPTVYKHQTTWQRMKLYAIPAGILGFVHGSVRACHWTPGTGKFHAVPGDIVSGLCQWKRHNLSGL